MSWKHYQDYHDNTGKAIKHSFSAKGIRTGQRISNVHRTFNMSDSATKADFKAFEKLSKIVELLKDKNVTAVDLNIYHLSSDDPLLHEFVKTRDDLDIIGNQVRKVNKEDEVKRQIETKEQNAEYLKTKIESLEKELQDELELLDKLKSKIRKDIDNLNYVV